MAYPAILQADWLVALQEYIEDRKKKPWQSVLAEQEIISEYSIYGTFVESVLKPADISVRTNPFNIMLWDRDSYDRFFESPETSVKTHPDQICVTVQSNLGIPHSLYETKIRSLLTD